MVISARSGFSPAFARPFFTAMRSAGALITSTEPSSFLTTSSAPASSAASMTFSSLVPGAKTNCPTCLKRNATEPSVPRLPPCFANAWRTSATVRMRLSVMQSTITAAPPGP